MYSVKPVVRLFAICYLNMYVYSLFADIILFGTIYLLKFSRRCFYSIIRTLHCQYELRNSVSRNSLRFFLWLVLRFHIFSCRHRVNANPKYKSFQTLPVSRERNLGKVIYNFTMISTFEITCWTF